MKTVAYVLAFVAVFVTLAVLLEGAIRIKQHEQEAANLNNYFHERRVGK